jgi:hypothetical protein
MKWKLTAVLLVAFFFGVLIGYMASPFIKNWFIPSDHAQIANAVAVYDATYGRYQTLYFERTGRTKMLSTVPTFAPNTEYEYSLWTFRCGDDVNAVMWIWGPNENGQYAIEIAKLAGNQIDVTWPDGSKDTNILYITWPR